MNTKIKENKKKEKKDKKDKKEKKEKKEKKDKKDKKKDKETKDKETKDIEQSFEDDLFLKDRIEKYKLKTIKDNKLKSWINYNSILKNIELLRQKYPEIPIEKIEDILQKNELDILKQIKLQWQIDYEFIFESDLNLSNDIDLIIKQNVEKIKSELRVKYFNHPVQEFFGKWANKHNELIYYLVKEYGYISKQILIDLLDYSSLKNQRESEIPNKKQEDQKDQKDQKEQDDQDDQDDQDNQVDQKDQKDQDDQEGQDDQEDQDDQDDQESSDEEIDIKTNDEKSISQHRKAFVKWVNEDFYKKIEAFKKNNDQNQKPPPPLLKIYQVLVQQYLSLETPYRGVLIYHGLGTGKTASAISLAEGLSTELKINTILPASLETEFIKEIQKWGYNELNKDGLWKYYSDKDISENQMVSELDTKYNLNVKNRKRIMKNTQLAIKRKMKDSNPEINKMEIKTMEKQILKLSGVWLPDKNGKEIDSFEEYEKQYILEQLNFLIRLKYNFIHYNPFPRVSNTSIKEFIEEDEEEDDYDLLLDTDEQKRLNTENKRIVDS